MAEPVAFDISVRNHLWVLTRDGVEVHRYSHVEQATHEAVRIARELEESGQPARVRVIAAEGKAIEITTEPEGEPASAAPTEERSAVTP